MHPSFLEMLCCPKTGSDVVLENAAYDHNGLIVSGVLTSKAGAQYPIVRGIPRFVSRESYAGSFGYEWHRWSRVQFEVENIGRRMYGHTTRMFDAITGFTAQHINQKRVVEFGCGPGRFLDIVRSRGGKAIGLELSSAVEVARQNFAGDVNVCIVQGDILHPPFKANSIDFGYSIGVLHHTPAPGEALSKLVAVVKPQGAVACCVYPDNGGRGLYDSPAVLFYRRVLNALPDQARHLLARFYSYFSAYVLYWFFAPAFKLPILSTIADWLCRYVFPGLYYLRDGRWRVLDTFDAITPHYASTHTQAEVISWFTKAGCLAVKEQPFGSTSIAGIKQ
jgi:SAM-dependent methyltransferase